MFPDRRKNQICCLIAACALALLALPVAAGATTTRDVNRAIGAISGASGAYAWNITDNRAISAKSAGVPRILASNTKLFTAAAVLDRYGTGGRFSTGVYSKARLKGGIISGSIYIRGGGDPLFGTTSFVTKYFGSHATIESLARRIKAAGVRRIKGGVYGDQSAFDSRRGTSYSGWGHSADIGGVLGGLIVDKGFVRGRYQGNPPVFAAQRLRAALRSQNIAVGSRTGASRTPKGAERIASVRSLPISALARQMGKPSNNYLAEMLVKSLALPAASADDDSDGGEVPIGSRSASTHSGDRVAERFAARLGSTVQLADGSGLSRSDRAAPREIVALLRGVRKRAQFDDFRASLPIAGVDGTLAGRMRGTAAHRRCQAKTGTLSNVSSLSGYCTTRDGDLIAFSVVQNRVSPGIARAQQDRIAAAIAGLD